jgi:hypothetical protein
MTIANIQSVGAKQEDYVDLFNNYFISDCFKRIYHSHLNKDESSEENLFNESHNEVFKDFLINEYSEIISKKLHIVQSLFNNKSSNTICSSASDIIV